MPHDVNYFFAIGFTKLLRMNILVTGVVIQGRDNLVGNLNRTRQTRQQPGFVMFPELISLRLGHSLLLLLNISEVGGREF
jgi:hypothetical protein